MSRVISGEPLPVPPEVSDKEVGAFFRKLIDYLRRLTAKLQAAINNDGSGTAVKTFASWLDEADYSIGASYAGIEWKKDLRIDSPYSHSTSTNPSRITILEDGMYLVLVDVHVTGSNLPVETALKIHNNNTGGDSLAKFGFSAITVEGSLSMAIPLPLIANVYLEVLIRGTGGSDTAKYTGSRITILKLQADSGGGVNGGTGWTTGWQLVEM